MTFIEMLKSLEGKIVRMRAPFTIGRWMGCTINKVEEDFVDYRYEITDKNKKTGQWVEHARIQMKDILEIWEDPRDIPGETPGKEGKLISLPSFER
jgi:uncharacterized protein YxjI